MVYVDQSEYRGCIYEGEWKHDYRIGHGVLITADGRKYEGEFNEYGFNGYGKLMDEKGTVLYEGEWEDGSRKTGSL